MVVLHLGYTYGVVFCNLTGLYSFQIGNRYCIFHFNKKSRMTIIRNQDFAFSFLELVTRSKTFYF